MRWLVAGFGEARAGVESRNSPRRRIQGGGLMKNLVSAATPFVAIMKILAFRFFCLTDLNAFFRALDYLIFREPGVVTDTHGSAMADRLRNSIQYEGGAGSENESPRIS